MFTIHRLVRASVRHMRPFAVWLVTLGIALFALSAASLIIVHPTRASAATLPAAVDLSQYDPPVGDQGFFLNSCQSWAIGYSLMGWYANRGGYYPPGPNGGGFAPIFVYAPYNPGGQPNHGETADGPVQIMTNQPGYPAFDPANPSYHARGIDTHADYIQGDFDGTDMPTASEVANASYYKISSSQSYQNNGGNSMQTTIETLLSQGTPVALGIPDTPEFNNLGSSPGDVVMPPTAAETGSGGFTTHYVFVPKYDSTGVWVENQWGTRWGDNGYGELSWAFVNQESLGAMTITPINPVGTPLSFTSASEAQFNAGRPGTFPITHAGGPVPYVTESGTLPQGLALSMGSGGSAYLAGTPSVTAYGVYPITLTAANGLSTVTQSLTVVVKAMPPWVTADPKSVTAAAGTVFSFTAAASGIPPVTGVQWFMKTIESATLGGPDSGWTPIVGANSPTYSGLAQLGLNGALFRAEFGNAGGWTATNPAVLSVPGGVINIPFDFGKQPTLLPGFTLASDASGDVMAALDRRGAYEAANGASTSAPLPLNPVGQVATDNAGDLVSLNADHQVLELARGATTPVALPFNFVSPGPTVPTIIASDPGGDVFVVASAPHGVSGPFVLVELPHGSSTQLVISLTGLEQPPKNLLQQAPGSLAVDSIGDVFVTTHSQVLELAHGSTVPTVLPFGQLRFIGQIAVTANGSVLMASGGNNGNSGGQILDLVRGATSPIVVPFIGLGNPTGVAVDQAGDVFAADSSYRAVFDLPGWLASHGG
jgi:hypothetical protein